MTNEQIIADIAMTIYGEDAVIQMLEEGIEIPLHTVQGWAARGPYRVKKNEHGIECRLWKKRKNIYKQLAIIPIIIIFAEDDKQVSSHKSKILSIYACDYFAFFL